MDPIDKFLKLYSYKFDKGYPDMNDKQDILLMESILKREFNIVAEIIYRKDKPSESKDEIIDIISNSDIELAGVNKGKIKSIDILKIFNIGEPSNTNTVKARNALLSQLDKLLSDREYEVETIEGSYEKSITPKIIVKKGDEISHTFEIKGAGNVWKKETTQKEGLVIFFYNSDVKSLYTLDSLKEEFPKLFENRNKYYTGLDEVGKSDVDRYLNVFNNNFEDLNKDALEAINDPLSAALLIKNAYGNGNPIITGKGTFDNVRKKGASLTGLADDKWNPGDVYMSLQGGNYKDADNWIDFNLNFTSKWGKLENAEGKPASFVSISLKQDKSAAGKGKSFLKDFEDELVKKSGDSYNLDKKDLDFLKNANIQELSNEIEVLQSAILGLIKDKNIKYDPDQPPTDLKKLKVKYAALKSLLFIAVNVASERKGGFYNAISDIASFAASLNGKNCSFFKVSGNPTGQAKMEPFPAETVGKIVGDIKIKDSSTAGGISIYFDLQIIDSKDNITSTTKYELTIRSGSPSNPQVAIELSKN